jgi:hypothetical protein
VIISLSGVPWTNSTWVSSQLVDSNSKEEGFQYIGIHSGRTHSRIRFLNWHQVSGLGIRFLNCFRSLKKKTYDKAIAGFGLAFWECPPPHFGHEAEVGEDSAMVVMNLNIRRA